MKNKVKVGIFERMPNIGFRVMTGVMRAMDKIWPKLLPDMVEKLEINEGDVVVDYGCGPARYTKALSEKVGLGGKVLAVDVQPLAIESVKKVIREHDLKNVEMCLATGYSSPIPDETADVVVALDMFHGISHPSMLLSELNRIAKKDAKLFIDDGHQPRSETIRKIEESNTWKILREFKSHLVCMKK